MSETISVIVPDNLLDKLYEVSSESKRSMTFHIVKAIEQYLGEYADFQIALDRLSDKDDKLISSEKLRTQLTQ